MILYNPPYSKNVRSNIAHDFLQLIDKHFLPSNKLSKLFNRHTVRVSYSCSENLESFISKHNKKTLKSQTKHANTTDTTNTRQCNCRQAEECPINGKCLSKSVVYQAEVTTADNKETSVYIGVTANEFKERYCNHMKSLKHQKYSNETELSEFIWKLKLAKRAYFIKWSIVKKVPAYKAGSRRCNLCLEEKLILMKGRKKNYLNTQTEFFTCKCRHVTKHLVTL